MAFSTSLETQTVMSLTAYATSSFSKHSLISTVMVVQNVVNGQCLSLVFKNTLLIGSSSCGETSYGQSSRRFWTLRSLLHWSLHIRSWLCANGGVYECPNLRVGADILLRRLYRTPDPSTSLHRGQQQPAQSSVIRKLARFAVSGYCMDWSNGRLKSP